MIWRISPLPSPVAYNSINNAMTMSQILAIDASTEVCSVAINRDNETISRYCDTPKSHSQFLLPMIDEVLQSSAISLAELDAFAVTCGPGSFTGIRIGMGIVQGLSYATSKPIVGVNTLSSMAEQYAIRSPQAQGKLVVALDARMGEIYWAVFELAETRWQALVPASVSAPALLCDWVHAQESSLDMVGVGHGWTLAPLQDLPLPAIDKDFKPHAEGVLSLALREFDSAPGDYGIGAVEPIYLRNEITWQKRKRIRE